MHVKASRSDDMAQSYSDYKSGYPKEDTNSQDVSTLVRPPRYGKTPSNQEECTIHRKEVGELQKGVLARDR